MSAELIHRDERRIEEAKAYLEKSIAFMQSVYHKLNEAGIALSLNDLAEIVHTIIKPGITETWLINRLAEFVDSDTDIESLLYESNILPGLKEWIINQLPAGTGVYYFLEPNLMKINKGRIIAENLAADVIESRFSFWAQTECGIELTRLLLEMAGIANRVATWGKMQNIDFHRLAKDIPGLQLSKGIYRPDVSFIRDQERLSAQKRSNSNTRTVL